MSHGGMKLLFVGLAFTCLTSSSIGNGVVRARGAGGEADHYIHSDWTTEDGLPQNSVTAIVQTRDGYLWLGTFGGLVRFDGVKFTLFNTTNSPGLKSNRILSLYEDRAGHLWIGTEHGGLTRYTDGTFTTYTREDGLPDDLVWSMCGDREGNLWVGTESGPACLNEGYIVTDTSHDGLTGKRVYGVCESRDGSIWFASNEGLIRYRADTVITYPRHDGVPLDTILELRGGRDGSVWVAAHRMLIRYHAGTLTTLATYPNWSPHDRPGDVVMSIYRDRERDIRFLTPRGVAEVKDGTITLSQPIAELSESISGVRVRSVIEDREGNLWVGTDGKGLHRFKRGLLTAYAGEEGLSDESFVPIVGDGGGGVWMGAVSGGLFRFHDGTFTTHNLYASDRRKRRRLIGPWALHQANGGGLWIGDYLGLHYYVDGQLTSDERLVDIPVMALYEDSEGAFWIGTMRGHAPGNRGGLCRLKDGELLSYPTGNGLVHDDVRFIMQDHQGALWIGTVGGLSRFQDGQFTNYTTENGLSHNYVRDIYEDADGTLWIGTYGGGLNRFREGRFVPITAEDGLYDNIVSRILEDDRGNFWMSCNRGIYRVRRRELNDFADGKGDSITCVSYGVGDGMKTSECNGGSQPAGWKTLDGRLWFPTIKGVVVVDPSRINRRPPPVHIEQMLIEKKPVDLQPGVEILPGSGNLEIHYTGLCFTAPEKVRFKYRLEGYDRAWVDAGARRTAYYTHLPPGNYRFQVIAANNDGVWNLKGASFRFALLPPFWRTWWFIALTLSGLGGLTVLISHRRISQLERAKRAQEEFSRRLIDLQESDRQRMASELHDSLTQSLVIIKNRALHSLQTPEHPERALEQMEEIAESASQALAEVRQIAYDLRPFQIDRLGLTKAIEAMVTKVAGADELPVTTNLDVIDGLLPSELEIHLYRIVQEGLNNIIKHAEATEASVTIKKESQSIEVAIQDNGKGFDPNLTTGDRSGFGWISVRERAHPRRQALDPIGAGSRREDRHQREVEG